MATTSKFELKVSIEDDILEEGLKHGPNVVGAIDQGTSSTRFLLFTPHGRIGASAQMEHTQIFPAGEDKVGWHEHDPIEIWNNTVACIEAVLSKMDLKKYPLAAIGITNQRETTIAWNSKTGIPYYNAIVWDDLRTTGIAHDISKGNIDCVRDKTGLPVASYFAGTKVKWLLDNVPQISKDLQDPAKSSQVRLGTIDTWLLYQLTGTKAAENGVAVNCDGIFVTDVSNASRWLFMDIATCKWDAELVNTICYPHQLPLSTLPKICPSSYTYAKCSKDCGVKELEQVPISAILGDQQAALFGQCAFDPGQAKCTYGTGLFLMKNTGTKMVPSTHGMLTTVAYQLGENKDVIYALEGSVSHSGSTIQWLRDQMNVITSAPESEDLAKTTTHNDGLYFVPAFAGLFAPHWRSDARACIVGMTATHHKGHICRAALEAAAYQAREVFDAIAADSNNSADDSLKSLHVDGGGTGNSLLMQFQADILGIPVIKPEVLETTSIGAAFSAGLAVGVWKDIEEIRKLWAVNSEYHPKMDETEKSKYWKGWNKAVSKSLGWVDEETGDGSTNRSSQGGGDKQSQLFSIQTLVLSAGLAMLAGYLMGARKR